MRVTNGMMMKRYSRGLNNSLGAMNATSRQIETGRRFQRGSEDPVRALKALQVRRNGDNLEQFHTNIESAESWLQETETAVLAVKTAADKSVDLLIQGRNDPLAIEDRQIIATNLRSIQEQLLKDLNTQIAGKYLLGGTNTKQVPFTVNTENGHLMFNANPEIPGSGVDVFELEHINDYYENEIQVYWDLTGEFKLDGTADNPGEIIDKSTVFNVRTLGLDIIGVGPSNLYNLIGRLAIAFDADDMATIDGPVVFDQDYFDGAYLDYLTALYPDRTSPNPDYINELGDMQGNRPYSGTVSVFYDEDYLTAFEGPGLFKRLQDAQQMAIIELVKVGEKANFVGYLKSRNEDNLFQAQELQNRLEAIPADEAIMNFKMQDYVYKACLQMGTYILQPGLMNYLKG